MGEATCFGQGQLLERHSANEFLAVHVPSNWRNKFPFTAWEQISEWQLWHSVQGGIGDFLNEVLKSTSFSRKHHYGSILICKISGIETRTPVEIITIIIAREMVVWINILVIGVLRNGNKLQKFLCRTWKYNLKYNLKIGQVNKSVMNNSKFYKATQMTGLPLFENEKTIVASQFRRKSRNPIWNFWVEHAGTDIKNTVLYVSSKDSSRLIISICRKWKHFAAKLRKLGSLLSYSII